MIYDYFWGFMALMIQYWITLIYSLSLFAMMAREKLSPRDVVNRPRGTREGPEPACVQTLYSRGGKCTGIRANERPAVVPSSRRGKYLQLDARRKNRAVFKGKWSPRGTGNRLAPPFLECAQVTGKAGENGQNSGEMGLNKTVGSQVW